MVDDDDPGSKNNGAHPPFLAHLWKLLREFANPTDPYAPEFDEDGPPLATLAVDDVDVGAWAAWTLVGLRLFSGELPSFRALEAGSRKVLLIAAKKRFGGNVSHMAKALGSSRRLVRTQLKAHGLYSPSIPSREPSTDGDE